MLVTLTKLIHKVLGKYAVLELTIKYKNVNKSTKADRKLQAKRSSSHVDMLYFTSYLDKRTKGKIPFSSLNKHPENPKPERKCKNKSIRAPFTKLVD